jgi:hypothetical protein
MVALPSTFVIMVISMFLIMMGFEPAPKLQIPPPLPPSSTYVILDFIAIKYTKPTYHETST